MKLQDKRGQSKTAPSRVGDAMPQVLFKHLQQESAAPSGLPFSIGGLCRTQARSQWTLGIRLRFCRDLPARRGLIPAGLRGMGAWMTTARLRQTKPEPTNDAESTCGHPSLQTEVNARKLRGHVR